MEIQKKYLNLIVCVIIHSLAEDIRDNKDFNRSSCRKQIFENVFYQNYIFLEG